MDGKIKTNILCPKCLKHKLDKQYWGSKDYNYTCSVCGLSVICKEDTQVEEKANLQKK